MVYLALIVTAAILLLLDILRKIKSKKILKLKRKNKIINKLDKLSRKLKLKKTKYYIKTDTLLKELSLEFTVEMFYMLKLILSIVLIAIVVLINYLNQVSIVTRINKLSINAVSINIDLRLILLVILTSILIPDLLIKQFTRIKKVIAQKEILVLQTYTIILINAGKNVKDIIRSLYNRSNLFKKNFELALNTFSSAPDLALRQLKNSTEIKSFKKIVIALEQCLNSDRKLSLIFLVNSRKVTKELNRLEKLKKDGNKRIFNTLMLILPLTSWIAVSGYPWFLYVIQLINNMPF